MMHTVLKISTVHLTPTDGPGLIFDMTGRCAFAICTEGEFDLRIMNERYTVKDHCMFACMPFVHSEVLSVAKGSTVVFGHILLEDVPMIITHWINTNNLIAIQNSPLVEVPDSMFHRIVNSLKEYGNEYSQENPGIQGKICGRIQDDIIDLQCRLIVARVLKTYLTNIPMKVSGHTQRDFVFQRFMLALYTNFREHRDVRYYAMRSGVSQKYFSTVVRQLSGSSPSEWIETVVVGQAKYMLGDISNSIKDIATALNFPDTPTFSKYFLRVTGMTPKDYRKRLP